MAPKGQSDNMSFDMKAWVMQRCLTEFLHVENTVLIDIHQWFLNVCGDQTVDMNLVRWWVVHFSSGDSDSVSLLQVRIRNVACRLLVIAGKNT